MAMNFATSKMELKKDPGGGTLFDNYLSSPSSTSTTTSSSSGNNSIFGSLGLGLGRFGSNSPLSSSINGSPGITCRICGKHEYGSNGEFETIKLGDLFPNMSSSALSSPVAATSVAVGLCDNCSAKGSKTSINPIFQQVKTENRSSLLLHHQQNLMPSMFRSWNSSSTNNSSNNVNTNTNGTSTSTITTTINQQYSPTKAQGQVRSNYSTTSISSNTTTGTISTSTTTGLPVSVLLANNSGSVPSNNSRKKNSTKGKNSLTLTATPTPVMVTPTTTTTISDKSVPQHQQQQPMALNLNLLASASVLSSEALIMGKKSSPTSSASASTSSRNPIPPAKRSKECSICNRTFKSAKNAEQHLKKVHNNVGSYCCDICGALFSYRGSLDSHLASHKPPIVTHDCPTCGQKFKEKANLNTHLKLHSETPKKFKCEFCPSGFSKKVNLRTHTKRKHPDQVMNTGSQMQPGQYNGGGMGMGYPMTPTMTTTVDVKPQGKDNNSEGKPEGNFKCEHCGRGFLFKNNLKAHLRTHTRDRKYTCEICEKSFIYKESLKNHMLLHSNEVPYQCDICLKKFRDRSNRRKHVKNVHKYMFVNGDSSSLAPIGSRNDPASAAGSLASAASGSATAPPAKKTRRKNNKTNNSGEILDPNSDQPKPKRNRKSKNSAAGSSSGNNNTVIVSNASCSDLERKIIMSPGPKMGQQQHQQQQQSLEYNMHSQSLPVTVHVPSGNQMFGRNVIVKATGASNESSVPLPRFSDPYNNRDSSSNQSSTAMQQNVIVYPKPKHSLLESYSATEPITQSSVISQHLPQYYTTATGQGQGLPIGVAYPEPSYSSLMVQSPRSSTPNQTSNTFESYALVNRRGSSGSQSKSPPDPLGGIGVVSHPQYSGSPAPIFSSPGPIPIKTEQPYFWTTTDNVNVNVNQVSHGHVSPFYNSPQHSQTSTPTPNPILDNNPGNILNNPSYSQTSELVGGMDPSTSVSSTIIPLAPNTATSANPNSFYYKDFDFSYL